MLAGASPQARAGGYTAEAFTIDWDHQHVTCPAGRGQHRLEPVPPARNRGDRRQGPRHLPGLPGQGPVHPASPLRPPADPAPRQVHQAVTAARAGQDSQQWKDRYKIRAGVEGAIRQATHVTGIRRARYLGLPKTRLEHAAAALNPIRLDAWWTGKPLDRTRTTRLQRIDLTTAA